MRGGAGAVLYTRRGCPLCFALARLAERSSRRHGVGLVETDVDADPVLLERYGNRVPVLDLPGGLSLSGRAGAREVDEAFAGAADFLRGLEGGDRSPWSPLAWLRRVLGLTGGRSGARAE